MIQVPTSARLGVGSGEGTAGVDVSPAVVGGVEVGDGVAVGVDDGVTVGVGEGVGVGVLVGVGVFVGAGVGVGSGSSPHAPRKRATVMIVQTRDAVFISSGTCALARFREAFLVYTNTSARIVDSHVRGNDGCGRLPLSCILTHRDSFYFRQHRTSPRTRLMELIADLQTSARHAQAALFSPDGGELITVGQDPAVKVWTAPGFELVRSLEGHGKSVNCAALTGDMQTLVTGSTDRTVRVWDFRKGTLLRTHKGHTNTVAAVRVSPDGRWAVSASYDGTVRLWPMQDDGDSVVLKGHKRNVISVEFVDGGATLASAGIGGEILLWDVESGEAIGALGGIRPRPAPCNSIRAVSGCGRSATTGRYLCTRWPNGRLSGRSTLPRSAPS